MAVNEKGAYLEYLDLSGGLYTADRAHLIPDNCASFLQDVIVTSGGIEPRSGSLRLGDNDSASGYASNGYVMKKRNGFEIPIKQAGTTLYYYGYDEQTWYSFGLTLTTGAKMAYIPFNDAIADKLYFMNGVEPSGNGMYKWTAGIVRADGAYAGGAGTITVKLPSDFPTQTVTDDFDQSGNLIVGGVSYAYTAKTGTTFTVGVGFPAVADGEYIISATTIVYPNQGNTASFTADAATDVLTRATHGLSNGQTVYVYSTTTLPGGLSANTPYYVLSATTNTFKLSATRGGTAIDITSAGTGTHYLESGFFANGTITTTWNTKAVISGVKGDESAFVYSTSQDAEDWIASSPRVTDDPGLEDFPEGGGAITSLITKDKTLVLFKKDAISLYDLELTSDGSSETPRLENLLQGIGVGSASSLATFWADNDVIYVSPRGGIKRLSRAANSQVAGENPFLYYDLTENIRNTLNDYDFGSACGIYFDQQVIVSCKSSSDSASNDITICYNSRKKALVIWNINASSWFIYKNDLYYTSSANRNVYKLDPDSYSDDSGAINAMWMSKEFTFGRSAETKQLGLWMVEGRIAEGTTLYAQVDYEENGRLYSTVREISGDNTDYVFPATGYSFGEDEFGNALFGSPVETQDDRNPFKVFIRLPKNYSPYKAKITFYSTGVGQRWIVTGHAPKPYITNLINDKLFI